MTATFKATLIGLPKNKAPTFCSFLIHFNILYFLFRRLTFFQDKYNMRTRLYSFKEYLHEKADESRHNETAAYLMFLTGAIFFVGGVIMTISRTQNPSWFIFFPYNPTSDPTSLLGLALTLSGIALLVYGFAVGIYYSRQRKWYMKELSKAHSFVKNSVNRKRSVERKQKITA